MNHSEDSSVQVFWSIQEIILHIEIHSTITEEMNGSEDSSVQVFWSIQEIIPHIEIHSTLHKKWMILNRVVFSYSDEFKKLSYTLRFIEHYIRNEWFSPELCSAILINSRNYPTHWDS